MDANFWHQKWRDGEIAFHQHDINPMLKDYLGRLNLARNSRIFLPLCGKTKDIGWLLSQGYQVAGAELSDLAVKELFDELGVTPKISTMQKLALYQAANLDIFIGDIFDLSADLLGPVDAIYDRAALVALPAEMRLQYTSHLIEMTNSSPQLLITYEYNQQLMNGPPFSISEQDIDQYYRSTYRLNPIKREPVSGGLKGKTDAVETLWILQ